MNSPKKEETEPLANTKPTLDFKKAENKNSCSLSFSNIVKSVELKENPGGLVKTNIAGSTSIADNTNVSISSSPIAQHKIILNQVSGIARQGTISSLMGPSGSGKTSLLDILSTRSTYQKGDVYVNGLPITGNAGRIKALKRRTAYIKQQDIFFDHLTVRDQLTYTAFLRLGDNYTKEEKKNEVDKVIELLRLQKCADTPIRLVSGGEKKRVNIGTELLTNPDLIILDEPTSGLDSTSAVALVELLVSLAHDHGKTIITSIHQPSSAVFHKFDNVLFLADGCVVFHGTPTESLSYCEKLGLKCPDGYNAADHWMDLLVEDSTISSEANVAQDEDEYLSSTSHFPITLDVIHDAEGSIKSYENDIEQPQNPNLLESKIITDGDRKRQSLLRNSGLYKSVKSVVRKMSSITTANKVSIELLTKLNREAYLGKETSKAILINNWDVDAFAQQMEECRDLITNSTHSRNSNGHLEGDDFPKKFNTSWTTQFKVLLHRSLKNSRSAILTPINIIKSVALGLLTGLLWYQIDLTESTIPDRGSFLFFAITYWIFDGTFSAIFTFPMERTIIFKERASGSYRLSAYFLSKTLSEMPTRLLLPSMFWTLAFWMSGLNPTFQVFLGTLGCTLMAVLAGESYGLLCGALVLDLRKL
ncbi:P-loop containing nucleoside triphosphate hydrolase protein [Chaetoceros tenuissimus]|uniref:P-loop containing nucleoside triphosphate hydrolase protein n=1 Tax=Chaetoceros tenuissimus TaxID=426638 RepID=A0AAD3CP91_9STRA|nr:P-loop containing nucleoside triphosphate hydrolase protein [Chaetoceros tenuissimus]